jgi:hypothetical protein
VAPHRVQHGAQQGQLDLQDLVQQGVGEGLVGDQVRVEAREAPQPLGVAPEGGGAIQHDGLGGLGGQARGLLGQAPDAPRVRRVRPAVAPHGLGGGVRLEGAPEQEVGVGPRRPLPDDAPLILVGVVGEGQVLPALGRADAEGPCVDGEPRPHRVVHGRHLALLGQEAGGSHHPEMRLQPLVGRRREAGVVGAAQVQRHPVRFAAAQGLADPFPGGHGRCPAAPSSACRRRKRATAPAASLA